MRASDLIEKENRKLPQETRSLIEVSANPTNRAIMLLLVEKGELSFKQLLGFFDSMNVSTLNYNLRNLMSAGALENHYKKSNPSKDEYSFYDITELGLDFLKLMGAKISTSSRDHLSKTAQRDLEEVRTRVRIVANHLSQILRGRLRDWTPLSSEQEELALE